MIDIFSWFRYIFKDNVFVCLNKVSKLLRSFKSELILISYVFMGDTDRNWFTRLRYPIKIKRDGISVLDVYMVRHGKLSLKFK
jgi:hypothetical protein